MTSTPATKRRRLDTASATLSKPFVSPFKTPLNRNPIEKTPPASTGPDADRPPAAPPTASPSNPTTTSAIPRPTSNLKPNRPSPRPPTTTDPALASLLKTHRALETRARSLRTEIDTLSQAVAIESSDSDGELVALIAKWKGASREAAESVFGDVRDRVNGMGGVGAWREMGRRREEWRGDGRGAGWGFDDGGEKRGGEEGEVSERGRAEEEDLVDWREEEKGGVVADEGADDDTFTMDMMLRSLNIDLDVIGFDQETQRWID